MEALGCLGMNSTHNHAIRVNTWGDEIHIRLLIWPRHILTMWTTCTLRDWLLMEVIWGAGAVIVLLDELLAHISTLVPVVVQSIPNSNEIMWIYNRLRGTNVLESIRLWLDISMKYRARSLITNDLMLLSNYTFVFYLKFAYFNGFPCKSLRMAPFACNAASSLMLPASNDVDYCLRLTSSSLLLQSPCTFEMIGQDEHSTDDHHGFSSLSISACREVVNCEFLMSVLEFAIFESSFTCFWIGQSAPSL